MNSIRETKIGGTSYSSSLSRMIEFGVWSTIFIKNAPATLSIHHDMVTVKLHGQGREDKSKIWTMRNSIYWEIPQIRPITMKTILLQQEGGIWTTMSTRLIVLHNNEGTDDWLLPWNSKGKQKIPSLYVSFLHQVTFEDSNRFQTSFKVVSDP